MKILFCTNAFENITNGPAKFANLILEINDRYAEHEIRILTEDVSHEKPFVYKVNLRIPRLLKPLGHFIRMFAYYGKIRRIRQEYAYDVLVYNNAFTGLWASLVSDVPTVGMINDDNNINTGWHNFKLGNQWLKRFLFKQCERLSVRCHQRIITNSDFLTKLAVREYGHGSKIKRMYKATDVPQNYFPSPRTSISPIQILFVKADFLRGNLQTLTTALSFLTTHDFTVTVIGPEERFKPLIESYFYQKDNVQLNWQGRQSPAVVRTLMQNHHIFCVPAQQEALGVANMEALAHGIPVVSTHVGGIPEVLDNGNNGWLVAPGDAKALAAAIRECIENPELRLEKSNNGSRFVTRFGKDAMFAEFLRIVSQVQPKTG